MNLPRSELVVAALDDVTSGMAELELVTRTLSLDVELAGSTVEMAVRDAETRSADPFLVEISAIVVFDRSVLADVTSVNVALGAKGPLGTEDDGMPSFSVKDERARPESRVLAG